MCRLCHVLNESFSRLRSRIDWMMMKVLMNVLEKKKKMNVGQ